MRKRILSILLTLCMVLALMPTTMVTYASETHKHCICGASHSEIGDHTTDAETTFTEWATNDSLPATANNYYLTTDVTISDTWEPADGTVLCLNGHTITCTGDVNAITINSGVSFTLTDCKTGDEMGTITHETEKNGSGIDNGGSFHMYGGSIIGNTGNSGGGVLNTWSTFNMYGGSITGNKATSEGGGVYSWGTFNMYGGSIIGNTGNSGGGVYIRTYSFTMSGGSITGNTATSEGGGVSMFNSTFSMSDGSISNNTVTGNGGGVSLYGTFTMSGGSITGNTATGNGGGVNYTWKTDSFTISGNVNISNNNRITSNETQANNVNFKSAITIGGTLANESSIGVNRTWSSWDTSANVTDAYETDYSRNFTSDDSDYTIYYDTSSKNVIIKMHEHVGVLVNGQVATCTVAGWKDYYKCSVCNKLFEEQACTTKITDFDAWKANEGKFAALGHDWKYAANGAVLTASCSRKAICQEADKTLTLSATSPAYSGNAATINIGTPEERTTWEAAGFTLPTTVEHYIGTTKLDSAPTTAGTYTAKITYEGATASINYTITDKPHTHSFSTAWTTDETYHWHICTADGCNGTVSDKAEHTAGDWIVDREATTEAEGSKHKACTVCGYVMETVAIPKKAVAIPNNPHTHSFSTAWTTDGTYHWHICTADGCDGTVSDKAEHTAGGWIVDKEATAKSEGSKHKACTVCGYVMETVAIPKETPDTPAFTADELKENSINLDKKTVVKWKKNKLTVSWGKVSGADGYDIFAAQCGKKLDMKSPAVTVKGEKTTVTISMIGGKKVSGKNTYKVKVKAYKLIDGKKQYIGNGQTNHVAGNDNKAYTNAKTVKVSQKSVSIKKGKTSQIKATIVKESKKKKLLSKAHGPSLRYYSTNTKIATVTSEGKITAKAKGTCYIYVTALNGVNTTVKVTVK